MDIHAHAHTRQRDESIGAGISRKREALKEQSQSVSLIQDEIKLVNKTRKQDLSPRFRFM